MEEKKDAAQSRKPSKPHRKKKLFRNVFLFFSMVVVLCLTQFSLLGKVSSEGGSDDEESILKKNVRDIHNITKQLTNSVMGNFKSLNDDDHRVQRTKQNKILHDDDDDDCISSRACIQEMGRSMARVFPDYSNNTSWQGTDNHRAKQINRKEGILLIKMPKAASSTAAGVAIRIARKYHANSLYFHQTCVERECRKRDRQKSFLFTTIRSPEKRSIGRIFYNQISLLGYGTSDKDIKELLSVESTQYGAVSKGQGGFQLRYAAMDTITPYCFWNESQPEVVLQMNQLFDLVQDTIDNYDFIIVTERLDESLVAMSFRLGISIEDILYSSTKKKGSYYLHESECIKIQESFVSPQIQQYLDSNRWNAMNYGDYLLHAAANQSLDLTIEAIGKERFAGALKSFQQLKAKVTNLCASKTIFPCTSDGVRRDYISKQNCYFGDVGCGHECMNQVVEGKIPSSGSVSGEEDSVVETTDTECISRSCIQAQGMTLARAFPDYSKHTSWQNTQTDDDGRVDNTEEGILLIKMPNAASSTVAGIAIRIARKYNANVRFRRESCFIRNCRERNRNRSFLFTTIRSPETRSISRIFLRYISANNIAATDYEIKKRLEKGPDCASKGQGGYQLHWASMERIEPYSYWKEEYPEVVAQMEQLIEVVQRTISNYDFIIVTERLDESLVAMSLLLGVPLQDVLYSSTRRQGSYYLHQSKCVKIQESFVSPQSQQFLDSKQWNAMNYGDYLLHAAANKSLDLTIDAIGQGRFDAAMRDFHQLKVKVANQCSSKTIFPCSSDGIRQEELAKESCYLDDLGCGHECIDDQVVVEEKKAPTTMTIGSSEQQQQKEQQVTTINKPASATTNTTTQCNSRSCIQEQGAALARIFPDHSNNTSWQDTRKKGKISDNAEEGILLIKIPKTASSTVAGVAIRIARTYNANVLFRRKTCFLWKCGDRNRQKSFLLTTVRSPEQRSMSSVFFKISVNHLSKTDHEIRSRLEKDSDSKGQGGFQLNYAAVDDILPYTYWNSRDPEVVQHMEQLVDRVQHTVDNYDFIIVAERFEESLVAMSFRLGISLNDIVYTSVRQQGKYFLHQFGCMKLQESFITPMAQEFLDSNQWYAMHYGDYLFHAAANMSLDLTIAAIGRERFDDALKRFHELETNVIDLCASETIFPCSSNGVPQKGLAEQNCYTEDLGCGYQCIDKVLAARNRDILPPRPNGN